MVDQVAAPSFSSQRGNSTNPLAAAYTELTQLLLAGPDVAAYLGQVAQLVSLVVAPPASCGITLRQGTELSTVACTGELAWSADELQYGRGQGPCLQAMRTAAMVHVPDMATETRWGDYGARAAECGVGSSLSLPLLVDGKGVGALNVYTTEARHFTGQEVSQISGFAAQASTLLEVVMAHAKATQLTAQMQDALTARAVIDQALGVVMAQQRCTATDAFGVLRRASQHRNIKLAVVAADLIRAVTGHDPQLPRGFSQRA